MSADLNAIKARHLARMDELERGALNPYINPTQNDEDRAWLLAEVERLEDNLSRVRTHRDEWKANSKIQSERAVGAEQDHAVAVTRIDEIEKWATDHFGDSTEFPTDLAFAFWGMPSAADLEVDKDECIDDTDLCEHGLRFGCKDCEESL